MGFAGIPKSCIVQRDICNYIKGLLLRVFEYKIIAHSRIIEMFTNFYYCFQYAIPLFYPGLAAILEHKQPRTKQLLSLQNTKIIK